MKLSKGTLDYISSVIKLAKILKIENIIIDKECVRGHHLTEGSMIIHRDNVPAFEFAALGISRINTLDTRLALLGDKCEVEATEIEKTPNEKIIHKLVFASAKTEVEFTCANPAIMPKSPKVFKDPIFYTFELDVDTVELLARAQSSMKGENISFSGGKKGVVAKLTDIDGDMMNHILSETLSYSTECDKDKFYFSYKIKTLLPLLREIETATNVIINITKRGILNLKINDINVYVAPEL